MNVNNWNSINMRGRGSRRPFSFRGRGRSSWHQGPPRQGMPWTQGFLNPYNRSKYNQQHYFLNRAPVPPRVILPPPKPPSPLPGSEEYTQRNIQQASDLIKCQLNLDGKSVDDITNNAQIDMFEEEKNKSVNPGINNNSVASIESNKDTSHMQSKKAKLNRANKSKPIELLDVNEIHDKIMKHISNLSYNKKINLVNNTGMAAYDNAIQQIQKQKRLELSRALRDMSNKSIQECSGDVINAIIPDFDIKLEDLSLDLISKLSSTLDMDICQNLVDPEECFKQAHQLLNNEFDDDVIILDEPENIATVSDNQHLNFSDSFDFDYYNKHVDEILPNYDKNECVAPAKKTFFSMDFNPNRSYLSEPTSSQEMEAHANSLSTSLIKVRTDLQATNICDTTPLQYISDTNEYRPEQRFNICKDKLSVQVTAQKDFHRILDSPSFVSPGNSTVKALSERSFVNNCESSHSFTSQNNFIASPKITLAETSIGTIPGLSISSTLTSGQDISSDNLASTDDIRFNESEFTKDISTDNLLNIPVARISKNSENFSLKENMQIPTLILGHHCGNINNDDENHNQPQINLANLTNLGTSQPSNDMSKEYEQFINQIVPSENIFSPINIAVSKEQVTSKLYLPYECSGKIIQKNKYGSEAGLGKAKVDVWLNGSDFLPENQGISGDSYTRAINLENNKIVQLVSDCRRNEDIGSNDKRIKKDENRARRDVDVIRQDEKKQDEMRRTEYGQIKDFPDSIRRNQDGIRKDDRDRRDDDRSKIIHEESKSKKEDDIYKQFKITVESRPKNDDKTKVYDERPRSREERYKVHEQRHRNLDDWNRSHDDRHRSLEKRQRSHEREKGPDEMLRKHEEHSKDHDNSVRVNYHKSHENSIRPDFNRVKDEVRDQRENKHKIDSPKKPSSSKPFTNDKDSRLNYLSKGSSWDRSLNKNRDREARILFDKKSPVLKRTPPRDRNIDKNNLSLDKSSHREKLKTNFRERETLKINEIDRKTDEVNFSNKIDDAVQNPRKKFIIPKLDSRFKNDYNKPVIKHLEGKISIPIVRNFKDKLIEDRFLTNPNKSSNFKGDNKSTKTANDIKKEVKSQNKTSSNKDQGIRDIKMKKDKVTTETDKKITEVKKLDIKEKENNKNECASDKTVSIPLTSESVGNIKLESNSKSNESTGGEDPLKIGKAPTLSKNNDKQALLRNEMETKKQKEKENKTEKPDASKEVNLNIVSRETIVNENGETLVSEINKDDIKCKTVKSEIKEEIKIETLENIACDSLVDSLSTSKQLQENILINKGSDLKIEPVQTHFGDKNNFSKKAVSCVKSEDTILEEKNNDSSSLETVKDDDSEDISKEIEKTIEINKKSKQLKASQGKRKKKRITEVLNTQIFQINNQNLTGPSPNNYNNEESWKSTKPIITRKSKRFCNKNLNETTEDLSEPKLTKLVLINKPVETISEAENKIHNEVPYEEVIPKKLTRNQKKLLAAENKIEEPLFFMSETPKPKRFKKGVNVLENIKIELNSEITKKVWKSPGEKKLLPFDLPLIQEQFDAPEVENNTTVELKFEADDYNIIKEEPVEKRNNYVPLLLAESTISKSKNHESQIEDKEASGAKVKDEIKFEPVQENEIEIDHIVTTRSGINRNKSNARPKSKQNKSIPPDMKRKLQDDEEETVPNKVMRLDINIPEKYSTLISVATQTEPVIIQDNINNLDVSNMRNTLQYMRTVDEQIESLLKLRKNLYDKIILNDDKSSSTCSNNNFSPECKNNFSPECKNNFSPECKNNPDKETCEIKEEPSTLEIATSISEETSTPLESVPEHKFKGFRKKPVRIPPKKNRRNKKVFEFSNIDECIDTVVKDFSEDLQELGYPKSFDVDVDTDVESTCSSVLSSCNKQLSIKLERYDTEQLEALRQSVTKPNTLIKKEYKLENYTEFESQISNNTHTKVHMADEVDVPDSITADTINIPLRDIDFNNWTGSILVIKVINTTVLAANDRGVLYFYDLMDGQLKQSINLGTKPLTSLIVNSYKEDSILYLGSLDGNIYKVSYSNRVLLKSICVEDPIQCMESAWGFIFVGSHKGNLIRYHTQKEVVDDENIISSTSVLVLRATQEGARRVLLVATRNSAVSVRDAMSGLLLRTLEGTLNPTVYTLLFYNNHIYCGTSQHDVLVYTFQDGQLMFKHEQSNTSGVVCMSIVRNLLFVGCYNGNIYVYNTNTNEFITSMSGPGGLFLSMEVTGNMVIAGTKQNHFKAWVLPQTILDQMTV